MIHSTCWSHILHLVGEEIRSKLKLADSYIASMKAALTKAPARRNELLDKFEAHGLQRKLPPVPVITRWGTWLEAGNFHFQHLNAELEFIESIENDSAAVDNLKDLGKEENLKLQLQKIAEICPTITTAIKTLEQNSLPASDVWLTLKTVQGALEEVFDSPPQKLNLYMYSNHPSKTSWEGVQYFDPRKASQFVGGTETIPASLSFVCPREVTEVELRKYKEIRNAEVFDRSFCPYKFWQKYSREMPYLSSAALKALCFPPSSAEVERSFSAMKRILTPQRTSLTEENLAFHLQLAFNQRIQADDDREDETEDSDKDF